MIALESKLGVNYISKLIQEIIFISDLISPAADAAFNLLILIYW